MSTETYNSLRLHPSLHDLFRAAEARYLTEEELDRYVQTLPEFKSRVDAAKEIAKAESAVCGKVAKDVTEAYHYDENHDLATKKCFRDICLTLRYATLSMLMNDPDWFRDKLLIWFKTILHSFRFPDQPSNHQPMIQGEEYANDLAARQSFQKSIFETYSLLMAYLGEELSEQAYAEIHEYLKQALDVLSND